jgi:hypothetical protein
MGEGGGRARQQQLSARGTHTEASYLGSRLMQLRVGRTGEHAMCKQRLPPLTLIDGLQCSNSSAFSLLCMPCAPTSLLIGVKSIVCNLKKKVCQYERSA